MIRDDNHDGQTRMVFTVQNWYEHLLPGIYVQLSLEEAKILADRTRPTLCGVEVR